MTITVSFRFVDAAGRDVSGTEEVAGYQWADFFDGGIEHVARADSAGAADALLSAAYKGPDVDGVGVSWTLQG